VKLAAAEHVDTKMDADDCSGDSYLFAFDQDYIHSMTKMMKKIVMLMLMMMMMMKKKKTFLYKH